MNADNRCTLFIASVFCLLSVQIGFSQTELDAKKIKNERLREILALPSGLNVEHSPNPVYARFNQNFTFRYIWPYTTTITPKVEGLTVVEFGGFLQKNGEWKFSNDTGTTFSAEDFKNWYSAPDDGVLLMGKKYIDPTNRVLSSKLVPQTGLWYFIAQGKDGKRYQGYALLKCLPTLEVPDFSGKN